MNESDLRNLINGVGAMSEIAALFYNGLISKGVPVDQAASITGSFIKQLIPHV